MPLSPHRIPAALSAALLLTWTAAVPASPKWLAGAPDIARHAERCAVYEWFFARLERQADGPVEIDTLARNRVINIANKLVAHHRAEPQPTYGAEIRYLLFTDTAPVHFAFEIDAGELEALLRRPCPGATAG